jgi:hypothetical protein
MPSHSVLCFWLRGAPRSIIAINTLFIDGFRSRRFRGDKDQRHRILESLMGMGGTAMVSGRATLPRLPLVAPLVAQVLQVLYFCKNSRRKNHMSF